MELFVKIISNFQLLSILKKLHLRCLTGLWISFWASIFGNWFLESLIHFSINSFISSSVGNVYCWILYFYWLQSYRFFFLKKSLYILYTATIKFDCSSYFNCILYFLAIHKSELWVIFSYIAAPCMQWCYKAVTLATLLFIYANCFVFAAPA